MKTRDDQNMINAIVEGGGDKLRANRTVARGSNLTRDQRDDLIRGLTSGGRNNVDAIREARRLEAKRYRR